MAAIPFMPLYVADYMADAAHLSTVEHGAYLLLIMTYWQRGESLPDDDKKLARICRLEPRTWSRVRPVISEFFEVSDGKWLHGRVERELSNVRAKSLKNRKGGLARAKQMHSERSANAQPYTTDADADAETEETTPNGVCASGDALTPDEIVEDWNTLAEQCGLQRVKKLTDERKRKLRVRLRQYPDVQDWQTAFQHIRSTPFLLGENPSGWRADFDFLLQAKSFTKLTEESYGKAN